MAAIGTIRKQSGLLIVLIGGAMVLFLLSDLFSSGTSFFTQEDQVVGTIAGQEIDLKDYELRVQEAIDRQFGVEGANERARKNIRDRVWQDLVRERVLESEIDALGISVSPDELLNSVKNVQPGSVLYQYFTDPNTGQVIEEFMNPANGQLDGQKVLQAINNLINSESASDWLPIERAIKQDIMMSKYSVMLTQGLVSTSVEANQIGLEDASSINFSYAVKEYSQIEAEEPSDEELQAYFNEHKSEERFQQDEEVRSVKIAFIELVATPEDIEAIQLELRELIPQFEADSNDTAFVGENADGTFTELVRFYPQKELNPSIKEGIDTVEMGAVFGPYPEGNRFVIQKLVKTKEESDSVRASHILISVQDGDTAQISAARAKLDSLKGVAESKNNFEELAKEFSEDFGSAQNGGDLNWFTRGRMVAPFENAAFNGEVGDLVIVESQFGVHLINITDRTTPKTQYLMASVDRLVEPSKETSDAAYQKASKFSIEHKDISSFDLEMPEGMMLDNDPNVALGDEVVGQADNAREMVRWIFEAEEGDVSSPFETERFIMVLAVDNISQEGTMSLEDAKRLITNEALNEKKANKVIAELGNYSSLEDAAKAMGVEIRTANDVSFSQGSLPGGLGRELKLMGQVMGMQENTVSNPISGTRGVFVARLDAKKTPEQTPNLVDVKRKESGQFATRINSELYDALQDAKGVDDERSRYY